EACPHLHRTLQKIKSEGMKAGVAINPHTPVSVLSSIIQDVDLVCLMSVNPGYGGQKFIQHTFEKLRELKAMIIETQSGTLIEIDGGVGTGNAAELAAAGADVLVAGSSVFRAEDPVGAIEALNGLVKA
ncbi:MAG: ribulose-phosphate 3-epimerase, partial [Eudoraea sp.]|nr:ribulose-phosphate 3-epimerase [Eudoraea sp.]